VTATKFSHSRFARQHPHLLVVGLCSISAAVFVGISLWFILDYLGTPGASDRGLVTAAVWAGLAIFCEVCSIFYGRHELHRTAKLFDSATEAKAQTDELFRMTDMLQSAEGYDDATAVLMATSLRLVPEFGAALYIFNNSRDRLDLAGRTTAPLNRWLPPTAGRSSAASRTPTIRMSRACAVRITPAAPPRWRSR
jgi:hypothetical protein